MEYIQRDLQINSMTTRLLLRGQDEALPVTKIMLLLEFYICHHFCAIDSRFIWIISILVVGLKILFVLVKRVLNMSM